MDTSGKTDIKLIINDYRGLEATEHIYLCEDIEITFFSFQQSPCSWYSQLDWSLAPDQFSPWIATYITSLRSARLSHAIQLACASITGRGTGLIPLDKPLWCSADACTFGACCAWLWVLSAGWVELLWSADAFTVFRGHCRTVLQPRSRFCEWEAWCGVDPMRNVQPEHQPWCSVNQGGS